MAAQIWFDEMGEKTSAEAERIIKKRDTQYFKPRVQRLIEFGEVAGTVRVGEVSTVTYDTEEAPDLYLPGYIEEAQESYLADNFRSCIFCCAAAAEQVIKYELALSSDDFKAEIKKIDGLYLGKLIKRLKHCRLKNERILKLKKFLDSFEWINDARISIAVHPLYASFHKEKDTDEMRVWKSDRMIKHINRILSLLDDEERAQILNLHVESPEGEPTTLGGLLDDPNSQHIPEVFYEFIRRNLFQKFLALESYRKMKEVIEGVYPD